MKKIIALVLVITLIITAISILNKDKTANAEGEWTSATVVGYNVIDKYSAECKVTVTMENDTNKYNYFSKGAPEIGTSIEVFLSTAGEILDVR